MTKLLKKIQKKSKNKIKQMNQLMKDKLMYCIKMLWNKKYFIMIKY